MTNSKKSRLMLTTAAMLLGTFLLSPFLGKANPVTASSAGAAPSPSLYLPLVMRPVAAPTPLIIYLPLVMRNFPLQTVFGAEMNQLTSSGGLDQMAAAHISWTRRNAVLWSAVEPVEGARNWSALASLESELQNASSKGIQVILIVRSTPQWARKIAGSGSYCGPISQDKLPAFGSFMRALVARYSVPPYNVKYWELWNEPDIDPSSFTGDNIYGCWGDQSDPYYGGGYYAEMLKAAYPQIKAANLQAQVLVGGLLLDCDPRPGAGCAVVGHDSKQSMFLEGILRHNGLNDGGNYFDGANFHAYDYYYGQSGQYGNSNWQSAWNTTGPVLIAKTQFIQSLLSQYGVSGKFLLNTESAVICGGFSDPPGQPPCESVSTSPFEQTKAYYVAQAYAMAIAQGLRANIWYSVPGWRNSGLLNADLSPRPAYTALQFSLSELLNAAWLRDVTEYPGVKGYEFQRGDRRIWVLWSLDGASHPINLPGVPLAAWDALGNSVSPAASMNVSLNPLYLEWNP
jgi:hypothetical protein